MYFSKKVYTQCTMAKPQNSGEFSRIFLLKVTCTSCSPNNLVGEHWGEQVPPCFPGSRAYVLLPKYWPKPTRGFNGAS